MKKFLCTIVLLFSLGLSAQKPCEISVNVSDSIGTYKSTKDYLIYEKNFAEKSSYIFASLVLTDGIPAVTIQSIEKSKDFIKAICFDKNSKIYLQLMDGNIITFYHDDSEDCGTLLRDENQINNRVLSGSFFIRKENFDALKKSPVSLMRIKYGTEMVDYIIKKDLKSELDGNVYEPEKYFMDYLHCIENAN